jgi:hypothetical protein
MPKWKYEIETSPSRAAGDLDAPSAAEINGGEEPDMAAAYQIGH